LTRSQANPAHQLIVAEDAGRIIATCQLTILSGLSRQGSRRALVEAVRVTADLRGRGIGAALMAEGRGPGARRRLRA
jgi:GNAT superfamily N-acetyltransferase